MSLQKIVERIRRGIEGSYDDRTGSIFIRNKNNSQFGESLTVSRRPIIELNSSYGPSAFRDSENLANGGTITKSATGEILLQTDGSTASEAELLSGEIGRYIPGYGTELGIGVRMPDTPTGDASMEWGGRSPAGLDGFHFGHDSGGLFVARLRNGVELDKTYQTDWTIDKLDGSGKSKYTLVPSNGTIYQINFTWYGYGQILFGVVDTVGADQQFIECHQMRTFSATSVRTPNLAVYAGLNNGTTGASINMYLGGRQYSIVGDYIPKYRFTGDYFEGVTVGTTATPIIAFRRKSDFSDRSLKFQQFQIINTGNTKCLFELRVGEEIITGSPSWGESLTNISDSETALEKQTTPMTGVSGGNNFWPPTWIEGGSGSKQSLASEKVDIDIPNGDEVVLVAYTLSGTTTLDGSMKFREEW